MVLLVLQQHGVPAAMPTAAASMPVWAARRGNINNIARENFIARGRMGYGRHLSFVLGGRTINVKRGGTSRSSLAPRTLSIFGVGGAIIYARGGGIMSSARSIRVILLYIQHGH